MWEGVVGKWSRRAGAHLLFVAFPVFVHLEHGQLGDGDTLAPNDCAILVRLLRLRLAQSILAMGDAARELPGERCSRLLSNLVGRAVRMIVGNGDWLMVVCDVGQVLRGTPGGRSALGLTCMGHAVWHKTMNMSGRSGNGASWRWGAPAVSLGGASAPGSPAGAASGAGILKGVTRSVSPPLAAVVNQRRRDDLRRRCNDGESDLGNGCFLNMWCAIGTPRDGA